MAEERDTGRRKNEEAEERDTGRRKNEEAEAQIGM